MRKERYTVVTSLHSGSDGAGIVWNLATLNRNQLFKGTSGLSSGFLHPNNVHGLILGLDNHLGYWDVMGGGELRNMILARKGHVTCMDLSPDGM